MQYSLTSKLLVRHRHRSRARALALALAALAAILRCLSQAQTTSFAPTGSMNIAREGHTAILLADGKVLVAGGWNGAYVSSAELYDPNGGTWSLTGSNEFVAGTPTLLRDGRVLVAGGTSAELYDPATGTWSVTGTMTIWRDAHTATLLADGRVLVAGGTVDGASPHNSAEIYDPASATWSATGSMNVGRWLHTATLLRDGRVLVTGGFPSGGGYSLLSTEVFDPVTERWTATGDMVDPRAEHTATLLPDGKVLLAGGYYGFHRGTLIPDGTIATAELYDPTTGTCAATGPMATGRADHIANLLFSGQALITGGVEWDGRALASAELYDPVTGTWSPAGVMRANRWHHTATLLTNGYVLVAGGTSISNLFSTAELYTNSTAPRTTFLAVTAPAMAVSPTSATLHGTVFLNNQNSAAWFEYGTTTNYSSITPVIPIDSSSGTAVAVSSPISRLSDGSLYHFRLVATNSFVTSFGADLTFTTREVPLVVNGGFETGQFTGWSQTGYSVENYVVADPSTVHSGIYGAAIGPVDRRGYLSQVIPTTPGWPYLVSFWLNSPDGRTPNEVSVTWDETSLFHSASIGAIGWTNIQFQAVATQPFTDLRFGLQNDSSYFGLDDISVVAIPSPELSLGGLTVANGQLALTWMSLAGVVYQLQYTTTLAHLRQFESLRL